MHIIDKRSLSNVVWPSDTGTGGRGSRARPIDTSCQSSCGTAWRRCSQRSAEYRGCQPCRRRKKKQNEEKCTATKTPQSARNSSSIHNVGSSRLLAVSCWEIRSPASLAWDVMALHRPSTETVGRSPRQSFKSFNLFRDDPDIMGLRLWGAGAPWCPP